jgi:hypothetical protein
MKSSTTRSAAADQDAAPDVDATPTKSGASPEGNEGVTGAAPSTAIEYYDRFVELIPDWKLDWIERPIRRDFDNYRQREQLVRQYAWAVPSPEALDVLVEYGPYVEIGAGTGYWASELQKRGVTIEPYDKYPPDGYVWSEDDEIVVNNGGDIGKSWYHRDFTQHTEVRQGTPDVLKQYDPEWNLFLCWPPMSDMAAYSLGYHRGKYIAYIGESSGGCTADRMFFRLLDRLYEVEREVNIPQWDGIHDYLTIYRHKTR